MFPALWRTGREEGKRATSSTYQQVGSTTARREKGRRGGGRGQETGMDGGWWCSCLLVIRG